MNEHTTTPWFKQVWPWIIIAIPLLTIIAGIITYQIAANHPVSMVQDDYFKSGLAINQVLERQTKAKALNISASIKFNPESRLLLVKLSPPIKARQLLLTFSHPTQKKYDTQIILEQLADDEFAAEAPNLTQTNWHIQLVNNTDGWLLKTRWHYPKAKENGSNNQITITAN